MKMGSDLGVLHRRKAIARARAQLPEAQALNFKGNTPHEKEVSSIDNPGDYMGNDSLGALTRNSLPQAGVLGGVSFTTLTFLGGAAIGYILYDEYKSKSRFDTKRLKYAAKVGALIGGGYAATHALTMAGQRGIIPGAGQ